MSATIPMEQAVESENESPLAADRVDQELRDAAIASLKRKRKFAGDAIGYVVVNGVLWLIWALSDGHADGGVPWPAWVSLSGGSSSRSTPGRRLAAGPRACTDRSPRMRSGAR